MKPGADFRVTLHHLSEDGTVASSELQDIDLVRVSPEKLRQLLDAIAVIAPKAEFPTEPELRIGGPHGRFLVQAKAGKVKVISWSTQTGGYDLTPDRILAMIMGMEAPEGAKMTIAELSGTGTARHRALKIIGILLLILGTNSVTAWMLTRPPPPPPPEILPESTSVTAERAKRVLADYAGDYETRPGDGGRRLTVTKEGAVHWVLFGPNNTIADDEQLTSHAAESRGHPVLVVSNFGMIEMKDPITVTYFGDVYRRK
jgi:hypothetical protein